MMLARLHRSLQLLFAVCLLAWGGSLRALAETSCTVALPCHVDGGPGYVALTPPGWDGKQALRVAVWLAGYRQPASDIVNDLGLVAAFSARQTLLLIPEAEGTQWSMRSAPGETRRDDFAYIENVLADARRRYPVQDGATGLGFSLGAMFLWTIACERPALFSHYVAFSGTFWRPYPEHCAEGRLDLLHIHGTTDTTVPMEGRLLRSGNRQGDIEETMALISREKRCRPGAAAAFDGPTGLACHPTSPCDTGGQIDMCVHPGGHWVDPAWVGWSLDRTAVPQN